MNFKVGDDVHLIGRYHDEIVTISKVSPTGRYRLKQFPMMEFNSDGNERGSESFARRHIRVLTDLTRSRIDLRQKRRYITDMDLKQISIETINKIYNILKEEE